MAVKDLNRDRFFMQRALDLAKKGLGKVAPNPMVGAVLVRGGKIISEGFHARFGRDHAEVRALAGVPATAVKGATLYVTLEPCCHIGKTPACTNFLINKGVERLIVAMRDPNPLVGGKGILQLKKAGVAVKVGVLEAQALKLNEVFVKNQETHLPFVLIKLGITLDGKIGTTFGEPGKNYGKEQGYITNKLSRTEVHKMRGNVDAILTTSETVLSDNPHLGLRLARGKDPLRVIIDSKLRTSPAAKIYRDKNVLLATSARAASVTANASANSSFAKFKKAGVETLVYDSENVPLKKLLQDLYLRGVYSLMVEAGSGLVTSLLQQKLADKLTLFIAPKILGEGIPWVQDLGIGRLKNMLAIEDTDVRVFGTDLMISGRVIY